MGARTLRDKRKRVTQHQRSKQRKDAEHDTAQATVEPAQDGSSVPTGDAQGLLPDCVRKLYVNEYGIIEEGCSDVALFSLEPETHAVLLQAAVPQRLVQLLCMMPFDPTTVEALLTRATADGAIMPPSSPSSLSVNVHKGIVFFQVTAAQALRNLITNSDHDEAIDALEKASAASAGQGSLLSASAVLAALAETALFHHAEDAVLDVAQAQAAAAALARRLELGAMAQVDLASALMLLVAQTWELVQHAQHAADTADWLADLSEPAEAEGGAEDGGDDAALDGEALTDAQRAAIEQAMHGAVEGGSATRADLASVMTAAGAPPRRAGRASQRSTLYFTLLGYLDELLQLVAVCVEGNERVASYWSEPQVVAWCLDMMHATHSTVLANVQHTTPAYFAPDPVVEGEADEEAARRAAVEAAIGFAKRREAHLCAAVLVSTSELLHTLSSDNASLAALLRGGEAHKEGASTKARTTSATARLSAEQQNFLNTAVGGTTAVEALAGIAAESDGLLTSLLQTLSTAQGEDHNQAAADEATAGAMTAAQEAAQRRLECHAVIYQLVQFTLALQATLLNVSCSDENVAKTLPLVVAVLTHTLPVRLWRTTALPLMSDGCVRYEALRKAALGVVTQRLRGVHGAVKVLHVAVSWVCEQNAPAEEDEIAFAQNPSAAILHRSNALYVFGLLLKDVLWLASETVPGAAGTAGQDVMQAERLKRDQHALREGIAGGISGEVSAVQFSVLATEVAVWGVSNMLLMMIPAAQLGDQPCLIWRAMAEAVRHRHDLLRDVNNNNNNNNNGGGGQDDGTGAESDGRHGTVAHSPAARQMVWLQLESIVQMLWTLQRKQAKAFGGPLESVNELQAQPADVDLLTRLAWEPQASPALQQSCVGAVVGLCCSLRTPEAVSVAVRFAVAMMSAATCARVATATPATSAGSASTLSNLSTPWFTQAAPTDPTTRHAWLAGLAALDGVVSVRCEAANALVDVFSDERYDAAVYVPLAVHAALQAYMPQVRGYLKRRTQLARELQRHYRVVAEPTDAGQWAELADNLDGFLDYKRQNVR